MDNKIYMTIKRILKKIWFGMVIGIPKKWIKNIIFRKGFFQERYFQEDYSSTILFTNDKTIFKDYWSRKPIIVSERTLKVSLISTVYNEINNIDEWIDAIFNQTRVPDEIIIVDAGSNDGTYEKLLTISTNSSKNIKIIKRNNFNIAQGRNLAIQEAEFQIIAATDFGCRPKKDWLENLIAPFEIDHMIQMVSGWYEVQDYEGNIVLRRAWPTLAQIDPASFIPSSRSIAFKKEVWSEVNGYPEWLTLTGEDTLFALELRKVCIKRAFVPDAIVIWFATNDWKSYWKKIYYWSIGDGESGLNSSNYWNIGKWILVGVLFVIIGIIFSAILLLFGLIPKIYILIGLFLYFIPGFFILTKKMNLEIKNFIIEAGGATSQVMGFIKGAKNRKKIDFIRYEKVNGIFFILAGVPIDDTGGGSRGAQLAREFLNRNYLVFYIHKFDSYESIDLGIHFSHPNLITSSLDQFSWKKFINEFDILLEYKPIGCLVEFPLNDFHPILIELKNKNAKIFYDLLDAWDTQLGSTWYKKEVELKIINISDHLIATAPPLISYLSNLTSKEITFIPNAVNHRIFNFYREYEIPKDFPKNKLAITYVGALWGEWFDWNLLIKIALSFPEQSIVVIGDYHGQCPQKLPNLHFLGLKAQKDLPLYLKNSNVAIIPWKVNKITEATSPLKLYEYLAMHLPTVVPNLKLLKKIPFVYTSSNENEFIDNIKTALSTKYSDEEFEKFTTNNSWMQRVEKILELLNS